MMTAATPINSRNRLLISDLLMRGSSTMANTLYPPHPIHVNDTVAIPERHERLYEGPAGLQVLTDVGRVEAGKGAAHWRRLSAPNSSRPGRLEGTLDQQRVAMKPALLIPVGRSES
jgi:hypothetical protein